MEWILLFGALGGVVRGLVGYIKHYQSYSSVRFEWGYFLMTVGISSVVGLIVVWAIDGAGITFAEGIAINPAIAIIIGYAGGDAIESLYKLMMQKPVIDSLKNVLTK